MVSISFSFGQNSTGGANFYSSSHLYGTTVPGLTSSGGSALVYVDQAHSDDRVVQALVAKGYVVTVASSGSDFNTKLSSNIYNLVVLFNQNSNIENSNVNLSDIRYYIHRYGRMIFVSWDITTNSFANLFEASFTGNTNQSSVTITDPIMANGITNPISLTDPGWNIFSTGLTPIEGGEVLATFGNSEAAIIRGNEGRTIMIGYLSDTPNPSVRESLITNAITLVEAGKAVPIPYIWIILAFVLIAGGVVFAKRKVIFS